MVRLMAASGPFFGDSGEGWVPHICSLGVAPMRGGSGRDLILTLALVLSLASANFLVFHVDLDAFQAYCPVSWFLGSGAMGDLVYPCSRIGSKVLTLVVTLVVCLLHALE